MLSIAWNEYNIIYYEIVIVSIKWFLVSKNYIDIHRYIINYKKYLLDWP